ncbi:MAG: sugar ABC transporter substrate-binding protein [Janthinobacterium lividum]
MNSAVRITAAGASIALALTLAACSRPSSTAAPSTSASSVSADQKLSIGFFGFAKSNSFAQAGFAGVQEYAAAHNATAEFLDSNFDGPTQVNQLQDAITSKRFQVAVIQANDGTAMVNPVKQAIAAGITVVVEFTPIGGKYDSIDPQVDGTINLIDPPTVNGDGLAKMALDACGSTKPCKVAYLQGFANYPLDSARTDAAVATLKAGGADVVSNIVGGYTPDSGRTAMQNLLQSDPGVQVVIGSSQAIEGAAPLAKGKDIKFVGNGGSSQAYQAVQSGAWYGTYALPEKDEGAKAAELGLDKARGQTVPVASNACEVLTTFACLGTKDKLTGLTSPYSD